MAGNGGKRKGAGRKKGSVTKVKKKIETIIADIGIGMLPLEFLLKVMRGEIKDEYEGVQREPSLALKADCAKAAAPYIHKKMPQEADVKFSGTLLCKWQD
jgi:hypothetical protein